MFAPEYLGHCTVLIATRSVRGPDDRHKRENVLTHAPHLISLEFVDESKIPYEVSW